MVPPRAWILVSALAPSLLVACSGASEDEFLVGGAGNGGAVSAGASGAAGAAAGVGGAKSGSGGTSNGGKASSGAGGGGAGSGGASAGAAGAVTGGSAGQGGVAGGGKAGMSGAGQAGKAGGGQGGAAQGGGGQGGKAGASQGGGAGVGGSAVGGAAGAAGGSSCGDGNVDYLLGEECDDKNQAAGDGCSATCAIEAPASCGDGTLDLKNGEECDDTNVAAGDGCSPSCQLEPIGQSCGDGAKSGLEVCDDSNLANGDGCNPTCNFTNQTSLFAGQPGKPGYQDATGTLARFAGAATMAVSTTAVFLSEEGNHRIRRVDVSTKDVTTLAGSGSNTFADHASALSASFVGPGAIATDGTTLWIADARRLRAMAADGSGGVTTIAGNGTAGCQDGNGGGARFDDLRGLTYYRGYVYLLDATCARIRRFDPATNDVVTLAGSTPGDVDGVGVAAQLQSPRYMTSDGSGMLYIADTNGNKIRAFNTVTNEVTTFAGSGQCGYLDGAASAARIHRPRGITSDGASVYFTEVNAHTVRQAVVATKDVSTMIGTPVACALTCNCPNPAPVGGYVEGVGAAAALSAPFSVAYHHPTRSLFVYDSGNAVLRQIK